MGVKETASNQTVLGIDIGGSGMKAAEVAVDHGLLLAERVRIVTPQPATPDAMAAVIAELIDAHDWTGPVGCTFPGVIRNHAVVETAANLDDSWVGVDASALFGSADSPVTMINDADAAGLAEVRLREDTGGVVFMLTIGTGLGTAVFNDGVLLPNTELGHIEIDGVDAEEQASNRIKKAQGLSTEEWAPRLERYLNTIEDLLSPDLFIIGGGISKYFDDFAPLLKTRARLEPARLRNHAGIVGAAMSAVSP